MLRVAQHVPFGQEIGEKGQESYLRRWELGDEFHEGVFLIEVDLTLD